MPDQANVFDSQVVEPQQQSTQAPASDELTTMLTSIKNEQGAQKYDSIQKALEGLANAQEYIPQLKTSLQDKEAELVRLRAELAQRQSVEDVVSRLTAPQQQTQVKDEPPVTSGLDEQAVMNLVRQTLAQTQQESTAQSNVMKVHETLSSKFGDKAVEVLEAKAKELGTTRQELGKLASQNPNLVLALFGTQASKGASTTTTSVTIPSSYAPAREELKRPEKSLLSGATSKEQTEYMRKIKAEVYAKHGITE